MNQSGTSASVHLHRSSTNKGVSSDPETFLEYLEEDRVIDGFEGAAQVEQDQDTGMPATVHVAHYSVLDVDHGGFGRMVCTIRELMRWQQIVRFHVFIEAPQLVRWSWIES